MAQIDYRDRVQPVCIRIINSPPYCCSIEEKSNEKPWYFDVKKFVQYRKYPKKASKSDQKTLRRMTMDYYLDEEVLYKRSFDGTLLRCLSENKARKTLHEIYEGICVRM
jgi:hypothetical protein